MRLSNFVVTMSRSASLAQFAVKRRKNHVINTRLEMLLLPGGEGHITYNIYRINHIIASCNVLFKVVCNLMIFGLHCVIYYELNVMSNSSSLIHVVS